MLIRYGEEKDFDWLQRNDQHIKSEWIRKCLQHAEYLIVEREEISLGFLRFSMFWGDIPYLDLIWIAPEHRNKGIGKKLFSFWENEMKKNNMPTLMTSSMRNESAPQEWHKKNGFEESGQLTFGRKQTTPEVFFIKEIG